jgi:hypothetical protein
MRLYGPDLFSGPSKSGYGPRISQRVVHSQPLRPFQTLPRPWVFHLIGKGERVVCISHCRILLQEPLSVIQEALLTIRVYDTPSSHLLHVWLLSPIDTPQLMCPPPSIFPILMHCWIARGRRGAHVYLIQVTNNYKVHKTNFYENQWEEWFSWRVRCLLYVRLDLQGGAKCPDICGVWRSMSMSTSVLNLWMRSLININGILASSGLGPPPIPHKEPAYHPERHDKRC